MYPFRRDCGALVLAIATIFLGGAVGEPAAAVEEGGTSGGWFDPDGPRGTLVLVGGGQIPEAALERFIRAAGGSSARIVVIPTASDRADELASDPHSAQRELAPWKKRGVADVMLLHARSRDAANDEALVAPLKQATAVWFGGGQQSRIADAYVGTAVEREIAGVLARGGAIGGTSAGAAIQSRAMIAGGTSEPRMAVGLDLLPGTIVDQHFLARNRQTRLRAAVALHPSLVGLGIDEGTALVVRGRQMEVIGASRVVAVVAASKNGALPRREIVFHPGDRFDLTMLRRAAFARAEGTFPPPQWPEPKVEAGALVIVGGGGMPREILERFMDLAGGPEAPIAVLPTANPALAGSSRSEGVFFERAGFKNVMLLGQRTKAEVESPEFEAALKKARGVWFGGGRQWRFVDAYAGTKAEKWIGDVLRRGGVIGGSSAGASIQAQYMVRGSPLGNEEMMAEGYEVGLGFLPGAAIDQHFAQRRRFLDMTSLMRRHRQLLGIGIDEATALVVRGQVGEVIGRGSVHFYDYRRGAPQRMPDYVSVPAGGRFDLVEGKVLPVAPQP
jgi:cyanophycinase